VRTYTSVDELEQILADPDGFPDDAKMAAISDQIREHHNFDVRAVTLLQAVAAHRSRS
jgi:hypothetical protein